jgi:hypothetical protein
MKISWKVEGMRHTCPQRGDHAADRRIGQALVAGTGALGGAAILHKIVVTTYLREAAQTQVRRRTQGF